MMSSGNGYYEKSHTPYQSDETPIARGIRIHSGDEGRKDSIRKQSVVTSLKNACTIKNPGSDEESDSTKVGYDSTHRKLKPRHIQLIGIGGTIGTALYVQVGRGLLNAGPGSLFLAITIWFSFILCVTQCMAEMVSYLQISSPFIRFAGRYVDDAFAVAAGYNFFIFEAMLVPFEIVACNVIIHY